MATTNEIYKFVKQNIQAPEAEPYQVKKIWMRNSKHLVVERDDLVWKRHFVRRTINLSGGFFSLPYEPYRPMGGNLVIDADELIATKLAHVLQNKYLKKHYQNAECPDAMPPVEQVPISECESTESVKALHLREDFQCMIDALHVTKDRINSVHAGMAFDEHVQRTVEILQRMKSEQVVDDMVLVPTLSDDQPELLNQDIDDGRSSTTLTPISCTGLLARNERIRKDHYAFLMNVHKVISCLRAIQTRDLRSKNPMSKDRLKEIMNPAPNRLNSGIGQVRFSRFCTPHRLATTGSAASVAAPYHGVGFLRRKATVVGDPNRIETWDDLMALEDNRLPDLGDATTANQYANNATRRGSSITDNSEEKDKQRGLPIWQQAADRNTTVVLQQLKKKKKDPTFVVKRARHNLNRLKRNLKHDIETELKQVEKMYIATFQLKMRVFDDMKRTTRFDTHCRRMMNAVALIGSIKDVDVPFSSWFQELKDKTQALLSIVDDVDDEIEEMLWMIGRFDQIGPKSIPYAKAKLCLYVMSLPAFETCQISVQSALKFVLEKILIGSVQNIHHWLSLRRLPWVLIK